MHSSAFQERARSTHAGVVVHAVAKLHPEMSRAQDLNNKQRGGGGQIRTTNQDKDKDKDTDKDTDKDEDKDKGICEDGDKDKDRDEDKRIS